jgi:hypothetical protein
MFPFAELLAKPTLPRLKLAIGNGAQKAEKGKHSHQSDPQRAMILLFMKRELHFWWHLQWVTKNKMTAISC